jgi:Fe-S cluster biosynthesis and repair protein YggX
MIQTTPRIEQFKTMSEANPKDELAFFSLGRAYADNNQHDQAAIAFARVIEINPKMSKAYQLLAAAKLKLDDKAGAIDVLSTGARVANERGDLMPRNDMVRSLKELGIELPDLVAQAPVQPVGEGQVFDVRTGQIGQRLPRPPFSNKMGQFIFNHTSAQSWQEWIGMGTKVINELRLPLSDPSAQKVFDQHMLDFLNLTELWEKEGK